MEADEGLDKELEFYILIFMQQKETVSILDVALAYIRLQSLPIQ